jgi:hypothetical protein
MKQLPLVLGVFVLTVTGGASTWGQPAFEYRHASEPPSGPSREYEFEGDRLWVELNHSPGSTGCVLYDDTTTPIDSGFAWYGFAIGNEVVLAGAECVVTELLIGLSAHEPRDVEVRAEIYANDGPDGEPGTQLWDSGWVIQRIQEAPPQQLISFPVPDVCVPGRITFAVEHLAGQGVWADSYRPPTIGNYVRTWFEAGDGWRLPGEEERTYPFMARVIAQPCGPSANEHTSWGRIKSMYR